MSQRIEDKKVNRVHNSANSISNKIGRFMITSKNLNYKDEQGRLFFKLRKAHRAAKMRQNTQEEPAQAEEEDKFDQLAMIRKSAMRIQKQRE